MSAELSAAALVRFTQYGLGAAQDADLAELSSLARAPEAPELWEINMHRHSEEYTERYCRATDSTVDSALADIKCFDPFVCHIAANAQSTAVTTRSTFDTASCSATCVYSHVHHTDSDNTLTAFFVASFVGETLDTIELGFVGIKQTITLLDDAAITIKYEGIHVDADVAQNKQSWKSGWTDFVRIADGSMILDHQDWKMCLEPSYGSLDGLASICTPDGVYTKSSPPMPLITVAGAALQKDQPDQWGCIQILWDAGLYEDEHTLSAYGDASACERLLRYEHIVSEYRLPRHSSSDPTTHYFTLRGVESASQQHPGRIVPELIDLGTTCSPDTDDEWCAESSQPFWQVIAQRVHTIVRDKSND